jgi:serine/threonine-protein kinase
MAVPNQVGRYRIIGELGRGGMGAVLRGIDPALEREVAVKIIAPRRDLGEREHQEMIRRFLREAKLAARINHPGVVTVYDSGQDESTLFLVMELVEGESLAQRLDRGAYPDRAEALRIVAEVAEALVAAHALGVVHRDIKPSNILITRDNRIKVTDFGVAKAIGEDTGLTRTGTAVGSPCYMSPEQVMGHDLDGRADLFSLGVVLFEMLLRRRPFPADTITTLVYQILNTDPLAETEKLSSLDQDLVELLRSCLAKDPSQRVADAVSLAAQARALAGQPSDLDSTRPTLVLPQAAARRAAARSETAETVVPTPPPLPPPPIETTASLPEMARTADRRTTLLLWLLVPVVITSCIIAVILVVGRQPAPDTSAVLQTPTNESGNHEGTENTEGTRSIESGSGAVKPAAWTPIPETAAIAPPPSPTRPELTRRQSAEHRVGMTPRPTRIIATPTPIPPPTSPPPPATPTFLPSPTPTPPIVETYTCAWGAEFNIDPEEAEVAIDGQVIGIADDWDGSGGGQVYYFDGPGVYYARFTHHRFQITWVKIIVKEDAAEGIADIDTEMRKLKER